MYDPKEHGANCDACLLRDLRDGAPVRAEIKSATVTVVAEAPGEQEVLEGRPLVGPAGSEFSAALKLAGYDRGSVSLVNALACRPPNNKLKRVLDKLGKENRKRAKEGLDLLPTPMACCRPRLVHDLALAGARNLIVMGKHAYEAVLPAPHRAIDDVAGSLWEGALEPMSAASFLDTVSPHASFLASSFRVVPTLHPSRVLHEQRHRDPFRKSIARAMRWFHGTLAWQEPTCVYQPDAVWFRDVAVPWLLQQPFIAVDTETDDIEPCIAGLDSVQIGTSGWGCSIAFRSIEAAGRPKLYDKESEAILRTAIEHVLTQHPCIVGHNIGVYDQQALDSARLPLRYDTDTVLLSRYVTPDLPNRLGYVGQYYTDVHDWKGDGKEPKDDKTRWRYGCLRYGTRVMLGDGSTESIERLVAQKYAGDVLAWNAATGRIEPRRVTNWHYTLCATPQHWIAIRTASMSPRERGLVVTSDHGVYVDRGAGVVKIDAIDVRVGDWLVIADTKLDGDLRCAVIGTLLGDSILVTSPSYRADMTTAPVMSLMGGHSTVNTLAYEKAEALHGYLTLGGVKAARPVRIKPKVAHGKPFQPLTTAQSTELAAMRPLFYDAQGRRRLYVETLEAVGPIGWAWWYMDDGCVQKGGRARRNTGVHGGREFHRDKMVLNTQRYPRADVDAAVAWFRERFGPTSAGADGVIRLGVAASTAFARAIAPYVLPSARYKLPREVEYGPVRSLSIDLSIAARERVTSAVRYDEPDDPAWSAHMRQVMHIRSRGRYCLTVEGNHNFFTTHGLVANCLDSVVNARIVEPLVVQARQQYAKAQRCDAEMRPLLPSRVVRLSGAGACTLVNDPVLAHDHSMQVIAREMHQLGAYVNQGKRRWCEALLRGEEARWLVNLQDALVSAGYKHLAGFFEDEIELAVAEAEARGDRMKLTTKQQRMIDRRVYAEWAVEEHAWNALDTGTRIKLSRDWLHRHMEMETDFSGGERRSRRTGRIVFTRGTYGDRGTPKFNPRSTNDVKRLLFDTWDLALPAELDKGALFTGDPEDGDRSVGDAVLRAYLADMTLSKEQHAIIHALRRAKKMRSLWSRFLKRLVPYEEWEAERAAYETKARRGDVEVLSEFPGFVVWPDGRARFNWNAHGTGVGRFSSGGKPARMNFQTIPDMLRIVFEPEPGNVYVGADLAAIHLRLIANLWRIPSLLDDFLYDRDPHVTLARMIDKDFDTRPGQAVFEVRDGIKVEVKPWSGDAKRGRNVGKQLRYAGAYGAAVPTVHATMTRAEDDYGNLTLRDLRVAEVRAYYEKWMGAEPQWNIAWKNEVRLFRDHGFLLSPILGRRADFLDGEDPNKLYNYRVLSGEGDIMGPATCEVRERLRQMGFGPKRGVRASRDGHGGRTIPSFGNTGLVGQFHDAMLIECPRESAVKVKDMLMAAMNVVIPGWPVPITAEAKIGSNWKEV